ncbi:hypothetical protein HDU93_006374 [Gonapodya sp. JEL0774]|nr:hypothetical protein HDU93_006374 [Gonapodya sp. JEL0774]
MEVEEIPTGTKLPENGERPVHAATDSPASRPATPPPPVWSSPFVSRPRPLEEVFGEVFGHRPAPASAGTGHDPGGPSEWRNEAGKISSPDSGPSANRTRGTDVSGSMDLDDASSSAVPRGAFRSSSPSLSPFDRSSTPSSVPAANLFSFTSKRAFSPRSDRDEDGETGDDGYETAREDADDADGSQGKGSTMDDTEDTDDVDRSATPTPGARSGNSREEPSKSSTAGMEWSTGSASQAREASASPKPPGQFPSEPPDDTGNGEYAQPNSAGSSGKANRESAFNFVFGSTTFPFAPPTPSVQGAGPPAPKPSLFTFEPPSPLPKGPSASSTRSAFEFEFELGLGAGLGIGKGRQSSASHIAPPAKAPRPRPSVSTKPPTGDFTFLFPASGEPVSSATETAGMDHDTPNSPPRTPTPPAWEPEPELAGERAIREARRKGGAGSSGGGGPQRRKGSVGPVASSAPGEPCPASPSSRTPPTKRRARVGLTTSHNATDAEMAEASTGKQARDTLEKEAATLKDEGNRYYRAGKYGEARLCYDKALARHATPLLHLNQSATLLKLQLPLRALHHARTALQTDPTLGKAYARCARSCVLLGRWDEATGWVTRGRKATLGKEKSKILVEGEGGKVEKIVEEIGKAARLVTRGEYERAREIVEKVATGMASGKEGSGEKVAVDGNPSVPISLRIFRAQLMLATCRYSELAKACAAEAIAPVLPAGATGGGRDERFALLNAIGVFVADETLQSHARASAMLARLDQDDPNVREAVEVAKVVGSRREAGRRAFERGDYIIARVAWEGCLDRLGNAWKGEERGALFGEGFWWKEDNEGDEDALWRTRVWRGGGVGAKVEGNLGAKTDPPTTIRHCTAALRLLALIATRNTVPLSALTATHTALKSYVHRPTFVKVMARRAIALREQQRFEESKTDWEWCVELEDRGSEKWKEYSRHLDSLRTILANPPPAARRNPYTILEISRTATTDEIRKAYRRAALRWHPDKAAPEDREEANRKIQDVNWANDLLSDAGKKLEWERQEREEREKERERERASARTGRTGGSNWAPMGGQQGWDHRGFNFRERSAGFGGGKFTSSGTGAGRRGQGGFEGWGRGT